MTNFKNEEEYLNQLDWKSCVAIIICLLFLLAYLIFEKHQFMIDKNVLILLFVGLGFLFIPNIIRLIKRLKISSFEIELQSVESRTFSGEVVQDDNGKYFYIAKDSNIFSLPDSVTANLLKSYKGILKISKSKLSRYGAVSTMESASRADLLRSKSHGDVFIILNKKKFYISSYGPLIDMNRRNDIKDVEEEELEKYETGR